MVMGNLSMLNVGGTAMYPSDAFNPEASLRACEKHKATTLYGVPTMFIENLKAYEKDPSKYDVSSLRSGIMAGSLCPRPLMEACIEKLGITKLSIAYGMTETSPVSLMLDPEDTVERRVSTVGPPSDHVEVKIVDDDGNTVPHDTAGDLWVRGYLTMLEYWGDEE